MFALLLVDGAALHDVLRGEPDLRGEYTALVGSLFVFAALAAASLRRRRGRTREGP